MKKSTFILPLLLLLYASTSQAQNAPIENGAIDFIILQINDVYEISPLGADNLGGLARVAQIRKNLLAEVPNVITVCAGDFISPSVIGTLKHEGKRIRGKQMVEVLNALGLDYTAFGNHEFDYDMPDLQARLDESNFTWIGTNVKQTSGKPFAKNKNGVATNCPEYATVNLKDADGTTATIGIFSACLPSNPKPYVAYEDHTAAARRSIEAMRGKTDFIVGLTHLSAEDDKLLLTDFPEIPLIMGGHEHDNQMHKVGTGRLTKADANAKTVYIHRIAYIKKAKKWFIFSELKKVDASIPEEPVTAAAVAKWEKIKNESLASSGFDPNKKVVTLTEPLDCREGTIRNKQAKVGEIITSAMLAASKTSPDCAVLNSGSIRVDDILTGNLTEVDIVRMLPFGGGIAEVEMAGNLLRRMLEQGLKNAGNGGYLQWGNIQNPSTGLWLIKGAPLEDSRIYRVVLPEFLLTGNEMNMAFLKAETVAGTPGTTNQDILSISKATPGDKADLRNDIRLVLINYWRK